jgi:hypothetical protein
MTSISSNDGKNFYFSVFLSILFITYSLHHNHSSIVLIANDYHYEETYLASNEQHQSDAMAIDEEEMVMVMVP